MAPRKDWHWADIKAALEKAGTNLTRLSERHDYDPSAARQVKHQNWPHLQTLIAKAIGVRPQDIWPSRYDERGQPIYRRHPSTARTPGHVQSGEAA